MDSPVSYISFARKYRPLNLIELKAQETLIKIISYAIANNRLAQGYLITGIRGIGKTTSARIIAKTANCTNRTAVDNIIIPCNDCQNCQSFLHNNHPDIIEMDAASKTGVEDIRFIIESCEYRPLLGKYKIFIIDEIHMLSKNAFNALLKVLEEPPQHIIFIFATTEVHKIPLTVISRCQRFDLRRFTLTEIATLLKEIAIKEKLPFDEDALKVIAYKSEGSARDAISILDQAANLTYNSQGIIIDTALINKLLGLTDIIHNIQLLEFIIEKDVNHAIKFANQLYLSGANIELFINNISNFIAYLSKVKILNNFSEDIYQLYNIQISNLLSKTDIYNLSILWQIFNESAHEIKKSLNQLISTEMLIIKAIHSQQFPSITQLNNLIEDAPATNGFSNIYLSPVFKSFLKYLYDNKEMDIYYTLFNELEINSFENQTIEIACNNLNKIPNDLSNLLQKWSNAKWEIKFIKNINPTPLKNQLISQIKDSREWKKLKQHFPSAEISDILFNN